MIALAGNPNVGKSTVFNYLTGLKQHTGNWAGKTVSNAVGRFQNCDQTYWFVDIPGTYSLMAHSAEEEVARDFICFGEADAVVVVCDATCLERNLNLVLQTIEIGKKVMVCVNLLDEAKRKGIFIDVKRLSRSLGVPVVGICARRAEGMETFLKTLETLLGDETKPEPIKIQYPSAIEKALERLTPVLEPLFEKNEIHSRFVAIKMLEDDPSWIASLQEYIGADFSQMPSLVSALQDAKAILQENRIEKEKWKDCLVSGLVLTAEAICDNETIVFQKQRYWERDVKIDRILTGRGIGTLAMLALLGLLLWITISGANYPSQLLWQAFSYLEGKLFLAANAISLPPFVSGMLIHGVYRVLAWVVSVMLPPMAIFFPLFTLLEDLGYLPRVAFNLDKGFQKCAACGKQALTMCMGFGCNAVGVTGCRIIDSKRERLLAVLTNNFVPCNGRFPTLIAIITMFFAAGVSSQAKNILAAFLLTGVILLGILMTFAASKLLSYTLLKGQPSSFALELPPYRRPKVGSVIVRSIFDRTVFVLGRAVVVAAPAGLLIWLMANVTIEGQTILSHCSHWLDPLGHLMGMDGVILLGFILGFPANEIVIPIIIMAYMSTGTLTDYGSLGELKTLLLDHGWTTTTALCTMVFSLFHWPCSTTLITVKKETGSVLWTFVAFLLPTLCGMILCMIISFLSRSLL